MCVLVMCVILILLLMKVIYINDIINDNISNE